MTMLAYRNCNELYPVDDPPASCAHLRVSGQREKRCGLHLVGRVYRAFLFPRKPYALESGEVVR